MSRKPDSEELELTHSVRPCLMLYKIRNDCDNIAGGGD